MEQILLETTLRHTENNEVTGDSQHSFTEGKWCLTNLVAFYERVPALVDNRRATDVIYLDLSKESDTVPHDTIASKQERHRFHRWTTWCLRTGWMVAHKELRSTAPCPSDKWCPSGVRTGTGAV